jgi:hypothetical protein
MVSKRGWLARTGRRASFSFRYIPLLALAATPLARANETQSCDEPTVSAVSDWAHAVRVASSTGGPKCADNNANGYLTLWIRDGTQLRAVMATNLSGRHSVVGVPACSDGDGVLEDADITVAVEKTTSHGFADLSLVARVNRSTYAGGKETKAPPRIVRDTLHYDGKTYGTDTFREFWYGDAP